MSLVHECVCDLIVKEISPATSDRRHRSVAQRNRDLEVSIQVVVGGVTMVVMGGA